MRAVRLRSILAWAPAVLAAVLVLSAGPVSACAPHPDLRERIDRGESRMPHFLARHSELEARGVGQPAVFASRRSSIPGMVRSSAPGALGEFRVLALLVEFSDKPSTVEAGFFDSLVFGNSGSTVHHYYDEVSYGQIDIVTIDLPSESGWQEAPQTYAYYVDGCNGVGTYPRNAQGLVENLVTLVDNRVDFSNYDNDGDGYVDVLLVIHSGSGAEFSGSNDDMWSHKWNIAAKSCDGVLVSDYTIQPEYWLSPGDMTIGVYAHELGHAFGLPDLYDTDYSSFGVGKWGIMSYGSWLGPRGRGSSPAHFCAWCKAEMGILEPTLVESSVSRQQIPAVVDSAVVFKLPVNGSNGQEYFLVENRQKSGYDGYLPGSGLLIWHVDDSKRNASNTDNSKEWYPGIAASEHLMVALEQADGAYQIEHRQNHGDGGDPFAGGLADFDANSSPSSNGYDGSPSLVSISGISISAPVMVADFTVGLASGSGGDPEPVLPTTAVLSQNYPNPFNPTTSISFTLDQATRATVTIYNSLGQEVARLYDGLAEAGTTTVTWDASNGKGVTLASGVYFYRLSTGVSEEVKKMVLLR
jgi:immune inhibitor A